jgi:hypothetical protein
VPRPDGETKVEALEHAQPTADAVDGGADGGGQGAVAGELAGALDHELRQRLHLGRFLDPGQVAQLLAKELLVAQPPPAVGEAAVLPLEGLGEAAELDQRAERVVVDRRRRPLARRRAELGPRQLGDRERVHAVAEVTPHQAVAAGVERAQPGAARHQHVGGALVDLEREGDPVAGVEAILSQDPLEVPTRRPKRSAPASIASFQATGAAALELAKCGGRALIWHLTILVGDALASVLFSAVKEVCAKMAEGILVLQSSDLMGRWSVSSKRTLPK